MKRCHKKNKKLFAELSKPAKVTNLSVPHFEEPCSRSEPRTSGSSFWGPRWLGDTLGKEPESLGWQLHGNCNAFDMWKCMDLHCKCIANAMPTHCKCNANALQMHRKCTANDSQMHSKCIANAWQLHGICMATVLQLFCKCMATA